VLQSLAGELLPFRLEVFDGPADPNAAPLCGAAENRHAPQRVLEHRLELPGRAWTLRFSSTNAFEAREHSMMPALVATGGILLSLLVIGLVRMLARQRDWVTARAQSMTHELRENRTMLETITGSARDAILSADPRGRVAYLNPAARTLFALAPEQDPALSLHALVMRWDGSPALDCRTATAGITECTG
jgi:PAS domain-containing protein